MIESREKALKWQVSPITWVIVVFFLLYFVFMK